MDLKKPKSKVLRFGRILRHTVYCLLHVWLAMKAVLFGALAAVLWLYFQLSLPVVLVLVFAIYNISGGWRFTRVVIRTLPRDARALSILIYCKVWMKYLTKTNASIPGLFGKTVKKYLNKPAFIYEGQTWTFRQVDEQSNAVANYFLKLGYRPSDVVAIFMESRPEYVILWLGLAKIGCVPSLINFNLRKDSLVHCIKACNARTVVYGGELVHALSEVQGSLPKDVEIMCSGKYDNNIITAIHLDPLLQQGNTRPPVYNHVGKFSDKLFYVYTSGTTGLPKPAIVIHSRFYYMAKSVHAFFYMNKDDIIYDTLPLYHTAGGILGIGQALLSGCTVVIRRKFSASNFWDDCVKYNCTVVQYIGEICRYLLAQPQRPAETQHKVKCAFGNGLRPQIWKQFMQRFNIKLIGEFYGATEGNANIANTDNTVGACGFLTLIAPFLYPITLVQVDEEGQVIRDRNGLCIKCVPGEQGELVGKIIKGDPLREFDGYADKTATQKKIAYDVFTKGDSAFLTGDVLEMDQDGYLFFRDRTGDTFRWKGENVSTSEVEALISSICHLQDATVYGVEIPGYEGRAGMAAIADENRTLDIARFTHNLKNSGLPAYARPVFLRLLDEVDRTGTFKLKKTDLRKKGFDPNNSKDHVYYLSSNGEYVPLDEQAYNDICQGKKRF